MLNSKNKKDVEKMISLGHSIDEKDRQGNTLVHKAVVYGDIVFLNELLDLGANPRIKNILGNTPIFYLNRNKDIVHKLLLDKAGPLIYTDFNNKKQNFHSKTKNTNLSDICSKGTINNEITK